jgi:protein gp37
MHVADRFSKEGQPYAGLTYRTSQGPKWTGKITLVPEMLEQPIRWRRPRRIFVNSMSDLFHESISNEYITRVFAVMAIAKHHTFQVLTKRPERMKEYMNDPLRADKIEFQMAQITHDCDIAAWPLPNVWLGVSVEDQDAANKRIPLLQDTPAAKRFLSMEPLLGPVDLLKWLDPWTCADCEFHGSENDCGPDGCDKCGESDAFSSSDVCKNCGEDDQSAKPSCPNCGSHRSFERDNGFKFDSERKLIDWVIVGGESGPKARPMHPQWARDIRDQCEKYGTPFLFKQWGEWIPAKPERSVLGKILVVEGVSPFTDKPKWHNFEDGVAMARIGKKASGRHIDGKQHDGYPGEAA